MAFDLGVDCGGRMNLLIKIVVDVPCCRHRWPVGCYGNTSFLCRGCVHPSLLAQTGEQHTTQREDAHSWQVGLTSLSLDLSLSFLIPLSLTHTCTHYLPSTLKPAVKDFCYSSQYSIATYRRNCDVINTVNISKLDIISPIQVL